MFDKIIQLSLKFRLLVVALAAAILSYGFWVIQTLPVDVFPDLNRPTVTIITEAHGLAPEEVETLVTFPIETSMNGANGVVNVRSSSSIGFSVVYVEFDWEQDIYLARQIVSEKLNQISANLPKDVKPTMGPISSIMGEIMFIGVTSENSDVSPMDLRNMVDWEIKPRLLGVKGVSQITTMGGEEQQYHILVDPNKLLTHQVTIHQVKQSLESANVNTTGGFMMSDYQEFGIRNLGRVNSLDDLKKIVIAKPVDMNYPALTLADIAQIKIAGPTAKRGDAAVDGKPAVMLAISKQPGADTISVTNLIEQTLDSIRETLPQGVTVNAEIFKQADFIHNAIENIVEALVDGSILVAIVLLLFLLNFRTTSITLVAIPLSFVVSFIIFKWFGLSINTMTLGGLAVAIGELVDDAIVDVENVFRRLRENKQLTKQGKGKPSIEVVYLASKEIRSSIVFATIIVILVFLPLFAMGGLEGKIFLPLGLAYVTSIVASLFVSLTVTPVLCSYLLPSMKQMQHQKDSWLVRHLKRGITAYLKKAFNKTWLAVGVVIWMLALVIFLIPKFGREFLPAFNEGSYTLNITMPPGTALQESNRMATLAEQLLHEIPEVKHTGRRTGRAAQDEHALGVNTTEIELSLYKSDEKIGRSKDEVIKDIRSQLEKIPGVVINIGQPISHRLDFITSGVNSQIAVKIFGEDLTVLRQKALEAEELIQRVRGIADLQVEQQLMIPQLHIIFDRDKARQHGVMIGEAAEHAELALQGDKVMNIIQGRRVYDVMLRLDDAVRADKEAIEKIPFDTLRGQIIPLGAFASVEEAQGPNIINREDVNRRIIVQANTQDRDVYSVVEDIKTVLNHNLILPDGYYIEYGGQFESQHSAQKNILWLSTLSLAGIFLVLYSYFKSVNLTLQVMLTIPLALIGSVIGVWLSGGVFSIATIIGFVTLIGISSRNGIMMISHYLHLMRYEGESFNQEMVIRGTQERLVPVLMTALTALLALLPLVLSAGETGKEILHPVAVVIFSGLFSSTILNLLITPLVFLKFTKNNFYSK